MRETKLEKMLIDEVEARGGTCYKFTSPGRRGVPDRMCVFPRGRIVFVELKRPKKTPNDRQIEELKALKEKNCIVAWINTVEGLEGLCKTCFPPKPR